MGIFTGLSENLQIKVEDKAWEAILIRVIRALHNDTREYTDSIKRHNTVSLGIYGMLYMLCYVLFNWAKNYFFENGTAIEWAQSTPAWPQGSRSGLLEGRTRLLLSLGMAGCQLVGSRLRWCATVLKKKSTCEKHTKKEYFMLIFGLKKRYKHQSATFPPAWPLTAKQNRVDSSAFPSILNWAKLAAWPSMGWETFLSTE